VFKFKMLSIFILILLFIVSHNLHAQIIKDDFRVNDDTLGGDNSNPVVEIIDDGSAIVVWRDGRNGEKNIYGQAYNNSGNPLGSNFKVSTYPGNQTEYIPTISSYMDSLIVLWRPGYGQWLLSDGSRSGSSFNLQSEFIDNPDAAVSDSGIFVVWNADLPSMPGSGEEIFMKRFDFNGDSISSMVVVNDDSLLKQRNAKIAMDSDDKFVVVWEDKRSGQWDIYGQLFDPSGAKIDSNFLINDDGGDSNQINPSCAMDSLGNFVVVWEDYRDGDWNIYGQRFNVSADTTGLGGNFLINDDGLSVSQNNPSCAMDKSGNFVVIWEDNRDGDYNIYGQCFDSAGAFSGSNFRIDQCSGTEEQTDPDVSMNEDNFVVTWQDYRNLTSIYKRRFLNDGTPVGNEVRVNDTDGTRNQTVPAVDMNTDGNVVVTWRDYRKPSGIYFQRLNSFGDVIGGNVYVDNGSSHDVSVAIDGSFVITYNVGSYIYYQMFTPGGDSIGSPAVVNDDSIYCYTPSIDINNSGEFVITWYGFIGIGLNIYAQRFNSTGDTIGVNFRVNDNPGTSDQFVSSIALTPSGSFLIVWIDDRNNDWDIYGQIYDADGNSVDTNFRINSNTLWSNNQSNPDVASLPGGNFIVVWQDYRTPLGIYAQVIDSMGTLVDTNFRVSDTSGYQPSVSASPFGGFVVTWHDSRDGNYNIYAQRYNPDYSPDSTNYKVNNELEGLNPVQKYPDVATDGTNMIFTWVDPRWQMGYDIAAKVVDWNYTSVDEKEPVEISEMLLPNLPNPFINSTLIRYQTNIKQKISIKIYDLSGRLITTLLDGLVEPGVHSQRWDGKATRGREVPAGIYFCRLDAGDKSESRKLVLLR
jgi:hypothetical protein